MPAARHWRYSTRADALRDQAAFAEAEGLPRKGAPVSAGVHGPIPDTYSEGAAGWSDQVVDIDTRPGGGPRGFALQRTAEAQKHEGKVVDTPGHGQVTLPDLAASEARGSDWNPADSVLTGRPGGGKGR